MINVLTNKIYSIGVTLITVGLAYAFVTTKLELNKVEADRDTYKDRIENQDTGYIVQLATCRNDSADLRRDLKNQNAEIDKLEQDRTQRVEDAAQARADAQDEVAKNRDLAARIRALELTGKTVCEQVNEIDSAFVEGLSDQ